MPDSKFVSASDRALVAQLLGREPRGLEAIQVRNAVGEPCVIRVSSLVDNEPFPTLFWLVDQRLCYTLDGLEASGVIAQIQHQIDGSPGLRAQLVDDHLAYIAQRKRYMTAAIKQQLMELGFLANLERRGIGGLGNFNRVRCLHTHYAAHLVQPNAVGRMVDRIITPA